MKTRFLIALELVVLLTALVLSPQLEMPWMLIDDGENLRMGQEIQKHFQGGDYSWILSYEKVNGRFRPAYWLWHYTNFKLFGFSAFGHHLGHLLLYTGISGLIFLITWTISRSSLAGLLAGGIFLFFYPTAENYYRLGTAEPPLLLFYLLLVLWLARQYFRTFSQNRPTIGLKNYFLFFIVLGLTYFMKESSPVLIPAFILLALAGLVDKNLPNKTAWLKFCATVLVMNIFFLLLVLASRNYYQISGGYTDAYIPTVVDTLKRFLGYLKMIIREYRWVLIIPLITFVYTLLKSWLSVKVKLRLFLGNLSSIQLWQIVLVGWFLLFLGAQSPWLYVMGRYLMPVTVWLAIFLGIEYAGIFNAAEKVFLKITTTNLDFRLPVLKILSVLALLWLVVNQGQQINGMYASALQGERYTHNLVKYLAEEIPPNGSVYANFSDGIMEYLYELPLHFKFFYARGDIKVDYLTLEDANIYHQGDFVIMFKEHVSKYPWEVVQTSFKNTQDQSFLSFGSNWKVARFKENETLLGIEKEGANF